MVSVSKKLINLTSILQIIFCLIFVYPFNSFSNEIDVVDSSTHYRIIMNQSNVQFQISKVNNDLIIKGNKKSLDSLFNWFRLNKYSKKYISSVALNEEGDLVVKSANNNIEAFSFVRREDKSSIIDFWENNIEVAKKVEEPKKTDEVKLVNSAPKKSKNSIAKNKPIVKKEYRDFRYGLNFMWDYLPMFPTVKRFIDIKRKTPMAFYELKDRDYEKSESEAHMQLTINLYRKEKWGLMNKSIDLYKKKYGVDKNEALNEFLKISALMKDDFLQGDTTPKKMVVKRLEELERISSEFNLSKAILKYVFQYYVDTGDFISSLKTGKRLFVLTKEDYDTEGLVEGLNSIIYSLSKINQYEKIASLLEDKDVEKYLDKIKIAEYKIYNFIINKKYEDVIKIYNQISNSIIGEKPASILFNVAESYFRTGDFNKAIEFYDEFIAKNSFERKVPEARLRVALAYDLLSKDEKTISRMYREVIDRSGDPEIRYEASLRYFGFEYLRKIKNIKDELMAFVEPPLEIKENLSKNLLKAKRLVRLRSLIVQKDYKNALTYLQQLPLDELITEERDVFRKDGSAALTYQMEDLFKNKEFSEVIRLHEMTNDKISDPNTYFFKRYELLGFSYFNLNIESSYRKIIKMIEKNNTKNFVEYPVWKNIDNSQNKDISLLKLFHLSEVKNKNKDQAFEYCQKIKDINEIEGNFCYGSTQFIFQDYLNAKKTLELLISDFYQEIENTEKNNQITYMYLMSLYQKHFYEKFVQISSKVIDEENFKNFSNDHAEELMYLYFETVYSKKEFVLHEQYINRVDQFISRFNKSKWIDRVRFLKGSSLIKMGKKDDGKKELDSLISTSEKEYIKDLARSELASLILNNKTI